MVEVTLLQASQQSSYEDFLNSLSSALVYSSLPFRAFLQEVVGGEAQYLVAWRDGVISGALPLFIKTDPHFGKVINSLPWYGSYGGVIAPMENMDTWLALLEAYREIVTAPDVLTATLITNPFQSEAAQWCEDILQAPYRDERICQISALPPHGEDDEKALLSLYRKKTRNLVRKASEQGFQWMVCDEDWAWQFLYETHLENMRSIGGNAKPWSHFVALRHSIPAQQRHLSLALLNDEPTAAMLLILYGNVIEYITPVIEHEYRSQQPLSFLIHQGMQFAVKQNFCWWNWGGTWKNQESLHHFKAGWGAVDHPYTYFVHARPESLELLRREMTILQKKFQYFFLFPYYLL